MNTNPDEVTLALWLDDELTGDELAAVEAWAASQPAQLAAREDIRCWRVTVSNAIPASEEPPYPDFFNTRILQAIGQSEVRKPEARVPFWRSWVMPAAACAGMSLAFWVGTQSRVREIDVAGAPRAIPVAEPLVYAPEKGVDAELVTGPKAGLTVIVLNGVAAIPDSTDFSHTVYLPGEREIDSTAEGGELGESW